jgi:hypothetical protein
MRHIFNLFRMPRVAASMQIKKPVEVQAFRLSQESKPIRFLKPYRFIVDRIQTCKVAKNLIGFLIFLQVLPERGKPNDLTLF